MSNISPKLIDVENNRIAFIDQKDKDSIGWIKGVEGTQKFKVDAPSMNSSKTKSNNYILGDGRFPTQLFTSIKNDRYKYVKHIT